MAARLRRLGCVRSGLGVSDHFPEITTMLTVLLHSNCARWLTYSGHSCTTHLDVGPTVACFTTPHTGSKSCIRGHEMYRLSVIGYHRRGKAARLV